MLRAYISNIFFIHLPTSRLPLVVFNLTTWMEAFLSYRWMISWMCDQTDKIGPVNKKISRHRFPSMQLCATRSLSAHVPFKKKKLPENHLHEIKGQFLTVDNYSISDGGRFLFRWEQTVSQVNTVKYFKPDHFKSDMPFLAAVMSVFNLQLLSRYLLSAHNSNQ